MPDNDSQVNSPKIPYGQTPNKLLYSNEISLAAKGLFGYMQAKPNGWSFSAKRIASEIKESDKTIKKLFKELIKAGYVERKKLSTGKMAYSLYFEPKGTIDTVTNVHRDKCSPIIKKESYKERKEEKERKVIKKSLKQASLYSRFNSCKGNMDTVCGVFITMYHKRWPNQHAPLKNDTIEKYENLICMLLEENREIYLAGSINEFFDSETDNDRHFPIFCHWLYRKYSDTSYGGFRADGSKMTVDEMIDEMKAEKENDKMTKALRSIEEHLNDPYFGKRLADLKELNQKRREDMKKLLEGLI